MLLKQRFPESSLPPGALSAVLSVPQPTLRPVGIAARRCFIPSPVPLATSQPELPATPGPDRTSKAGLQASLHFPGQWVTRWPAPGAMWPLWAESELIPGVSWCARPLLASSAAHHGRDHCHGRLCDGACPTPHTGRRPAALLVLMGNEAAREEEEGPLTRPSGSQRRRGQGAPAASRVLTSPGALSPASSISLYIKGRHVVW